MSVIDFFSQPLRANEALRVPVRIDASPTQIERLREMYVRDQISLLMFERAAAYLIYNRVEDTVGTPGVNPYAFAEDDWGCSVGLPTPGGPFDPHVAREARC